MASAAGYVPAWPVLNPFSLLRAGGTRELPFPLSVPNRSSFYVARNAIYHLFRTLSLAAGESVLVPDYHSGNEVWAIRAAGAELDYYSIGRDLQPDLGQLRRLVRPATRVLYVIHFIGWPQPILELQEFCRDHGLVLVEDCALSFLSRLGDRPLGSFGDYAVYCLYKSLPVPNGGVLVQNNPFLPRVEGVELERCGTLSVAGRSLELMLNWVRACCDPVGRPIMEAKRRLGRFLSARRVNRIPVGDIGFDLANVNLGMSAMCEAMLDRFDYDGIVRRRRANYSLMEQCLEGRGALATGPLAPGVCPLFYPILVRDKRRAAEQLERAGIEATQFWNYGDPAAEGRPDASYLREHVLELPIHQGVEPAQVERIARRVLELEDL
jgi:dTDP-4-amino-4,6-dideoxygalactose transaminase